MLHTIKRKLYFFVARYFRFWAAIRLRAWKPRIVLVTGSSGKTTLVHLLESQIGKQAQYSHFANSSFGVPFHILGLQRKTFGMFEWPMLILQAPFQLLKHVPREKLYIVEADSDRPGEARFMAKFLRPHVTMLLNITRTHAQNFDKQVSDGTFDSIDSAIQHEFWTFAQYTQENTYIDADLPHPSTQIHSKLVKFSEGTWLKSYSVDTHKTTFVSQNHTHIFTRILLPKSVWLSIAMCEALCNNLNIPYDYTYANLTLPPGRSSVFEGVKNTTIIDSSYNSNYDSMRAMLELFQKIPHTGTKKWIVLGDMIQLGNEETEEHEKLAHLLKETPYEQLILIGPRLAAHTYPFLDPAHIVMFDQPKEALEFMKKSLTDGETILFKGSRFLEGIIEQLLADKKDVAKLCRRETVWQKRRNQWGLGQL